MYRFWSFSSENASIAILDAFPGGSKPEVDMFGHAATRAPQHHAIHLDRMTCRAPRVVSSDSLPMGAPLRGLAPSASASFGARLRHNILSGR